VSQKPAHVYIDYSFVIDLPILIAKFVSNTGDPTIVLVVHIKNMIAHFIILFVLIVLGKFVQTPQVLCD